VLIAAGGTALGLPILDPIIGLLIGIAILFITRDATVRIWCRLMDAVDPGLVNRIEHYTLQVEGVQSVKRLRVRWVGHQLFAEIAATVEDQLSLAESHQIARQIEQTLHQAIPHLSEITLQIAPQYAYESAQVEQKIADTFPKDDTIIR